LAFGAWIGVAIASMPIGKILALAAFERQF
jgi:hypothetical protein